GKRVHTSLWVVARCASRSSGRVWGFSPGLCKDPRNPSSKTDFLEATGTDSDAIDLDVVSLALSFFGSCVRLEFFEEIVLTSEIAHLPLGLSNLFSPELFCECFFYGVFK